MATRAKAGTSPAEIVVRGAREHNLRNLEIRIPRDQLVVITGLSGSGKSSLAFDTIYAEGQRRYVESLSAYARQFLEQMGKPDLDSIDGLSPAIAIEQRTLGRSPRSTVGTTTEIYDYLRLLFARVGQPHCPGCDAPISSQTVQQITDRILGLGEGARVQVLAPIVRDRKGEYKKELEALRRQGYVRIRVDGEIRELFETPALAKNRRHSVEVVIDRVVVKPSVRGRIAESVETALGLADGLVAIDPGDDQADWILSERNACVGCGISYPEISPRMFSFNSPHGACPECDGLGSREEFDPARIVPDPSLSIGDGAIAPWSERRAPRYYQQLTAALLNHFGADAETPWKSLPKRTRQGILFGFSGELSLDIERSSGTEHFDRNWDGVVQELERRCEQGGETVSNQLARFRSPRPCEACQGTRLCENARSVRLGETSIDQVAARSIEEVVGFIEGLSLSAHQQEIADRILREIEDRLRFLQDVGLGYLTLERSSASLSGGEGQRIRLATQVGSSLMGVLYILDEPSIGLHPRDNERLLTSLLHLRDIGNSVLVVEHDEATIRAADYVIDMGPGAGVHGGQITAQGTPKQILNDPDSLTGAFLSGRRGISIPPRREATGRELLLEGCTEHNLKGVTLRVPIGSFTTVTGVSGSGKSTLVDDTLFRALAAQLHGAQAAPGAFEKLTGLEHIDKVVKVDQAAIGRTPRSNPATYTGVLDGIRQIMSQVPEARVRGYTPGRFSFNVKGGRCEACQGDGLLRIEMHFLPDLFVTCEICGGRRYNRETLEIRYKGRSIADVLEMTVEEALTFMENVGSVRRPLQTLHDVGLGYLQLGQSATTLSGGEAQRVKLARELSRRTTGRTLYILDEPTTGLHFADVEKLLEVLGRLVEGGNSVIVIEHHPDVIKSADHVVDLGPEGGSGGGEIVVAGTPEEVARCKRSHTGRALASLLSV
ncbi:excinuclease ABC subunit UvrA [Myxococcota bacterium]|nr:excinuclease ABC subunit UvrA [Myxococcota bacterium]